MDAPLGADGCRKQYAQKLKPLFNCQMEHRTVIYSETMYITGASQWIKDFLERFHTGPQLVYL